MFKDEIVGPRLKSISKKIRFIDSRWFDTMNSDFDAQL